jgi:hypothetical protein
MALKGIQREVYEQKRYATRKAQGLCPYCGKRPPYAESTACLPCRKRLRTYSRRHWRRTKALKQQGLSIIRCACRKKAMVLCIQCQAPLCDTCYDVGEGHCRGCLAAAHAPQDAAQGGPYAE